MLRLDAIDLGDLAMALENHFMDYGTFFWLDPETGQIDLWGEEVADETGETVEDLAERGGIRIEPVESNVGYRDMEVFASNVRDRASGNALSGPSTAIVHSGISRTPCSCFPGWKRSGMNSTTPS